MEQILRPKVRSFLELGLIVVLLSLLFAIAANFAVAFLADQQQIVSKPYDLGGLILGSSLMALAATIALLTRRPGIVTTFAMFFFIWFFYWSGENVGIVLRLMPYAVLLPAISVYGAWFVFKALGRHKFPN